MYAQDGGAGEFALWVYQDYAKAMLEAAAPHLIQAAKAEAWDEGRVVGMMDPHRIEQSIKLNAPEYAQVANPYR